MSLHTLNLSKPFPPCPAPSNSPLPFAIDEMDFSAWLTTLANEDDMAKCQKILRVLQTLNNAYPPERNLIPGRTRLFFLEKLGAVLAAATAMLTLFPSIPDEPAESATADNDMGKSEISVWSSLELANGYSLLSQENWFKEDQYYSEEEKALILTNGIQAMGRGLLYTYQTYAKPYVYFWHKCFQFYRLAQLSRLSDSETNPATALDNAFKRVLVFALSNTNQFSPAEMRMIYELLGHYAVHTGLLKSVPKKKFKGIPSIHLKGNGPPAITDEETDHFDSDRLYIATVTVASKILEATYDKRARHMPTDRLMLLRLAKTLTLNEQRKDPREMAEGNQLGTMGFDNIIELLRSKSNEKQSVSDALPFDLKRPGELRDLNFEIATAGGRQDEANVSFGAADKAASLAFSVVEFTDPTDIWKSGKSVSREYNMRLVDKSAKGYGLLWTDNHIKPKVGSIIGIIHKTMTIGLIRWLAQSKETGMFMGVELLGGNAAAVKVSNPGYPDAEVAAIFLQGNDALQQSASLIFINKDFKPSEFVYLNKGQKKVRYRLTKQLHLTSFINHVDVVRSH